MLAPLRIWRLERRIWVCGWSCEASQPRQPKQSNHAEDGDDARCWEGAPHEKKRRGAEARLGDQLEGQRVGGEEENDHLRLVCVSVSAVLWRAKARGSVCAPERRRPPATGAFRHKPNVKEFSLLFY
tara:strand:- start:452 stop:832 length:381 start_codon:yes stop_codon:yes gene_type:complete